MSMLGIACTVSWTELWNAAKKDGIELPEKCPDALRAWLVEITRQAMDGLENVKDQPVRWDAEGNPFGNVSDEQLHAVLTDATAKIEKRNGWDFSDDKEIEDLVPVGWNFHTADMSLTHAFHTAAGNGSVSLVRDKAGRNWWFSLSEEEQERTELYIIGHGLTLKEAVLDAAETALAARSAPL